MISHGWPIFSRWIIVFTSLILLTVLSTGCAPNGSIRWKNFPISIYSDQQMISTGSAQADFQDAMNFWETKSGRKLFEYKGVWNRNYAPYTGTPDSPGTVLENVIFFQNPWGASSNVIGQTVVNSYGDQISHAMIMLNPFAEFCSRDCAGQYWSNSARKNLVHELGHFIGLRHNNDINNVMYPVLQPGGSLDEIIIDEIELMKLIEE
jgi:hypothetical protein